MTTQKKHDIKGLLAELSLAEQEFNKAAALVKTAVDGVWRYKGSLNEQQFVKKLENAAGLPNRVDEVIRAQDKIRCSYQSARLALLCAVSELTGGLRGRDKLLRTIMKLVATMPHVTPDERNLLGTTVIWAIHDSNQVFEESMRIQNREEENDLTTGKGRDALVKAYERLWAEGKSGQEVEPGYWTTFSMLRITMRRTGLSEPRFAGEEASDKLVELAGAAVAIFDGARHRPDSSMYHNCKGQLNEPQYASRLEQAVTGDNPAAVGVIKNQQVYKRIEFLTHQQAYAAMVAELEDLAVQMRDLQQKLKPVVANAADGTYRLVAMNNVVAAAAICTQIDAFAQMWKEELVNTHENRVVAGASLCEEVNALVSTAPYSSLRWSCHGPGEYTEPL